ncbi:MAG: GDP-L-fucose synthase [Steroidobacteraceae bacterium]
MEKSAKIYVAGHRGLAGSALVRRLREAGYENLVLRAHKELELTDGVAVRRFFETERPHHVVLAAAKVGGILANDSMPGEFIHSNLAVQTNVIHESWRSGVKRLLFLGSSCIYPRECPQPMKEEYLLTGPLEPTNRPYALAKIAGIEMCSAYNRQYGTQFLAVMPTNLYGPGDNYDLQTSHVLPALIRKAHEAKTRGAETLVVWGTGKPKREFLYSDDMADACVALLRLDDGKFRGAIGSYPPLVNVGAGKDLSIRELAELVCGVVGFKGRLEFDATKPDGTPRKLLDTSRLERLGWRARIGLREGIGQAYEDFKATSAERRAAAHG